MASSENPNKSSYTSSPKPENPFVAFRQFADSQISSLLQGVLGLPSALSKSNEPRWDTYDENMRRRDDLLAKQQALKDSEERKQDTQSVAANSSGSYQDSNYLEKSQSEPYRCLGYGGIDLPLYSPVTKSLFDKSTDGDSNWGSLSSAHLPWYVKSNQDDRPDDVLPMVRSVVYNNLQQSTRLHSQNSLLPYLLYSPYSPIHLQQMQKKYIGRFLGPMSYVAAFDDLLGIAEGRPRVTEDCRFESEVSDSVPSYMRPEAVACWGVRGCLHKIDWYASNGLLENPVSMESSITNKKASASQTQAPGSELDMYGAFLRMAQHPASASDTFESLFKEVEKIVEEEVGPKESAFLREQRLAFVKKHGDDIKGVKDMLSGFMVPFEDAFKEESKRLQAPLQTDPKRVVSTTTTTEHTTGEDGTVETSVTVEKVFADGRVTTTFTSHTEDTSLQISAEEKDVNENNIKEDKTAAKKGWFWN